MLAGVQEQHQKDRNEVEPLEDRIWWAYMSITTVGLGDFYFPHETFLFRDMWLMPLPIMVGFVLLAIFLLKCAVMVNNAMNKAGITDDESLNHIL